jgi:hypothetical protein
MNIRIGEQVSSQAQLSSLANFEVDGQHLLVHGSVGHAALMGMALPPHTRFNGTTRDIDVFLPGATKTSLENLAEVRGVSEPNPLDAGLCGLLLREGNRAFVTKTGVTVELGEPHIFDEIVTYEIPGTEGIQVRSLSPLGLLAVDRLEPPIIRPAHLKADLELANWFRKNNIEVPPKLQSSIDEFHRAYKEAYPRGTFYRQLAGIYVAFAPESIRGRLRQHTHRFMRDHAGRDTPYVD